MSSTYDCGQWILVKAYPKNADPFYKIMACWHGGYTYGDSWKLSSGFNDQSKVELIQNSAYNEYHIANFSGSTYICARKENRYGLNTYAATVYNDMVTKLEKQDFCKLEALPFEQAIKILDSLSENTAI